MTVTHPMASHLSLILYQRMKVVILLLGGLQGTKGSWYKFLVSDTQQGLCY